MIREGNNGTSHVIQFGGERDPHESHGALWEILKKATVLLGDVERRIPLAFDDETKAKLQGWQKELEAGTKTVGESLHIVTPSTTVEQLQAAGQPLDILTKRIQFALYPETIPPIDMRVRFPK